MFATKKEYWDYEQQKMITVFQNSTVPQTVLTNITKARGTPEYGKETKQYDYWTISEYDEKQTTTLYYSFYDGTIGSTTTDADTSEKYVRPIIAF